jgi:hypothetical protein
MLDRVKVLQSLADSLDLDNNPDLNAAGSDDFDAAIHEADARNIILWAQLRSWLRQYSVELPLSPGNPLPAKELEENIDIALDEPTFFLTQGIMRGHLTGKPPLTLGGVAELRYRHGSSSWDKYKKTIANEMLFQMRDLQLWSVVVLDRADNGGGGIAGYKISAGAALVDFHHFVFKPQWLRLRRQFDAKFRKELGKE